MHGVMVRSRRYTISNGLRCRDTGNRSDAASQRATDGSVTALGSTRQAIAATVANFGLPRWPLHATKFLANGGDDGEAATKINRKARQKRHLGRHH